MPKFSPKIIVFCFLAIALLLKPATGFALEISYPTIFGVAGPHDLPSLLNYLYYFLLLLGIIICFGSLLWGGLAYLVSSGNPGKIAGVKQQISASFFGLTVILLSFLILNILNPDAVILKIPGLNYPVNQPLIPPSEPSEMTIAFYELPMGVLQERVLDKTQAITSPVNYPEIVATDVRTIEQKSKELRTFLEQCKCSNLKPDCDTNCSALECTNASGGEPSQLDLCPNLLTEIKPKQQEIKQEQKKLKSDQRKLKIAQLNLELASGELGVARALLSACLPSPMDKKAFLGVKDTGGIIVKYFFTDAMQTKVHPVTFYCQLDSEFVKEEWNTWQQFYKNTLSQMVSGGWSNCNPVSSTLPGPWPDSGPGGEIDINFNNETGDVAGDGTKFIGWEDYPGIKSAEESAIAKLKTSPNFMSWLKGEKPVELYLADTCNCLAGGWTFDGANGRIVIYADHGDGNDYNTLCTLAHELGHVMTWRSDISSAYDTYVNGEEKTPYAMKWPDPYTQRREDIAETIGIYTKNQLLGESTSTCSGGTYDLNAHPGHKAFGEYIFGTAGGTLPPPIIPPTEEGSIDCDQSASLPPGITQAMKDWFIHLASIWTESGNEGTHASECFNDVVSSAWNAGVNPSFALTIWLEESGASNYNLTDSDFGVISCATRGFKAQLNKFLEIAGHGYAGWECPAGVIAMERFLEIYSSGECKGNCGWCLTIERSFYLVTNGRCGPDGYLPESPADMSCY